MNGISYKQKPLFDEDYNENRDAVLVPRKWE
jgi:hypothetical protein